MKKRLLIVFVLFAALLGGVAYFQLVFKPQMIKGFIAAAPRAPVAVTTTKAQTEKWIPQRSSIGTLVAFQGIDVAAQVGGIVAAVKHDSGEDVSAGTALIDLDTSVEAADVVTAKANLRLAEISLQRAQNLASQKAGPVANVDQALATRDIDAAAEKRAEAVVSQKTIVAPFAGRLGIRKVDKGAYVSPGMALISLQQLDPIRIDFPMQQQDYAALKIGQKVQIGVDAWPDQTFDGKVSAFEARVASDTRTLLVRGEIPNPDKRLLPGMFANVAVLMGEAQDVVTVPQTAVSYSLYGDAIWVVKPGAAAAKPDAAPGSAANAAEVSSTPPPLEAERRVVTVGEARGDRVSILKGLAAGEEVVTTGQIKLMPGAKIQIDNAQALKPSAVLPRQ